MSDTTKEFQPPKHWTAPEELTEAYWQNASEIERRGQEFYDKPIETVEKIFANDKDGVARRDFLKVMGASMALASFACARRPVHKIIPYVIKPESITPGVATYYASTARDGSGILVKTREGRPIKLEGNPDHPVNQGKLSLRNQAEVLNLYDPDRLKAPVEWMTGVDVVEGRTWATVDEKLKASFAKIRAKKGKVRVLSTPITGPATRRVLNEFLSKNNGKLIEWSPLAHTTVSDSQALCYGEAGIPQYNIEKADVIVSLSGDFMSDGSSSTENMRGWSKNRKLNSQNHSHSKMSRLLAFESNMSLTGANADERFTIRPGDELKIALALISEVMSLGAKADFTSQNQFRALVANSGADKASREIIASGGSTKLTAQKIKAIAKELWENAGRSLVISGSLPSRTEDGLALQIAVNALNSLLGNEGKTVDGSSLSPAGSSIKEILTLVDEMKSGSVDALIFVGVNPVYHLPREFNGLSLEKVPVLVAISDRVDETAKLSHLVLPQSHFLESWGDHESRRGLFSLTQPTIFPIHESRTFAENLLVWNEDSRAWHDVLKADWEKNVLKGTSWEIALQKGLSDQRKSGSARKFKSAALDMVFVPKMSDGVSLALTVSEAIHDGSGANNPWLQEVPDTISTVTWDNFLSISPKLAAKLDVKTNDVVRVKLMNESGTETGIEIPAYVQPGQHSQTVSVSVGYGRWAAGAVGNDSGVNVQDFARVINGKQVFSGHLVDLTKTGRRFELAAAQAHNRSEGRPIVNDMSLDDFIKDPKTVTPDLHDLRLGIVPSIWTPHKYEGYRWGMAVDLNSCTGCNACVVACQSENNIPTVGRNQVRVSREMHWLRLDRYYSQSEDEPEVVFQPMLCQHCENASCETVCPVLATVHSSEGLNEQVYNRCVGTRYCQNNCPYKVRRFNFFDYWKAHRDEQNKAWNPDVTVRTRGIMEKCTFCVQRIQSAKDDAKKNADKTGSNKIKDGNLQTACQQTCPTDAIVFGDINDPNSKVSKLHAEHHQYRVFENLNNRPVIAYLSKVRNRRGEGSSSGGHHS